MSNNFVQGYQASLEKKRYDDAAPDRAMLREERQLGLDAARRQVSDDAERRRLIEDATSEPVVKDFDASDNAQTMGRAPRKMSLDDHLNLYERLGEQAMKSGRLSPEQAMQAHEKIRAMETEGHFDAYNEYRRTGDIGAAVRMFNSRGKKQIDPKSRIEEVQKKDPLTDQPYTAYSTTDETGKSVTFDPLQMARESGGARGFLDSQKTAFEARKVGALEQRESNRDTREQRMSLEAVARGKRDDRKADQMDDRLRIMEDRADRPGGAQGGVFGYKMDWLKTHLPEMTEEQRYSLATGQRNIPEAQIRKWAEDAVGRAEKLTGIPMKGPDRARAIESKAEFLRGMKSGESAPGLPPRPGSPGGGRPALDSFVR